MPRVFKTFTCIEWTVLSLLMSNFLDRSSHDLHTMTSKSIEVMVFGSKCTNIPLVGVYEAIGSGETVDRIISILAIDHRSE